MIEFLPDAAMDHFWTPKIAIDGYSMTSSYRDLARFSNDIYQQEYIKLSLLSAWIDFAGIFAIGPEVLRQLVKISTNKDLPPTQAKVALIVFQHASWKIRCKMNFRPYPLDSQVHNGQLGRKLNIYKSQLF